ncbi:MAG: serine hydrolase domain-containing protein [Pseudomonadota bacterium]
MFRILQVLAAASVFTASVAADDAALRQTQGEAEPGPWADGALVGMALAASAPELDLTPPDYLEDLRYRLDQAATSERVVGLAAALIENGQVVMVYTSGEAAAGSGQAITPDTVFRAASVTKSFTGTLLAKLEADGLIDLDAPVPTSWLRLKADRQPTWLELVSHQTGLPPNAYDNLIEAGYAPDEVRERLAEVDLICPLGECYTYQNVAFAAAARLIEDATGLSYEEAVRRHLFEPYGLARAGIGEADLVRSDSWARPHRGWRRTRDRAGNPRSPYDSIAPAASITLSLNDFIGWAQAHLSAAGGVPLAARDRAFAEHVRSPRETRNLRRLRGRVDDTAYGLGWRIYDWGDRRLIAHGGYLSGYGAHIVMEPETGFAFVALWNADARAPFRLWPTVMDLRTGDGPGDWIDQIRN